MKQPTREGTLSRQVHLDTDFAGDPDDACALALLLGWPDTEIIGITTNLDTGGRRAGCVAHYLKLAGREGIPIAAGAEASMTTGKRFESTWGDPRYWPEPVEPRSAKPGAALDLLGQSIERGAMIIAIGAYTNLALLEAAHPGSLSHADVVATGGWVRLPAEGLPSWGPEMDFNVQCDTRAAEILASKAGALTFATPPVTMTAQLRATQLSRLRASGPVGELLALQSEAHAKANDMEALGRAHTALPDDLVNFHWDPVTCAVAVGWPGAEFDDVRLVTTIDNEELRFEERSDGRPMRILASVDAQSFTETWLASVEAIGRQ